MKTLSLKLKDEIFLDVEEVVKKVNTTRNAYINEALRLYNLMNKRKLLRKKLHQESKLVHAISMEVLKEMEQLQDDHL